MLHDDMIHGGWAGNRSRACKRIERETPILPRAIAGSVLEEASAWLGEQLPTSWIAELEARANTVYPANQRFRRRIRGGGNSGRDWLWAFTRHWLAALLKRRRPELFIRLPHRYCVGQAPNQNRRFV